MKIDREDNCDERGHDWDEGICIMCGEEAPEPDDMSGATPGDR